MAAELEQGIGNFGVNGVVFAIHSYPCLEDRRQVAQSQLISFAAESGFEELTTSDGHRLPEPTAAGAGARRGKDITITCTDAGLQ